MKTPRSTEKAGVTISRGPSELRPLRTVGAAIRRAPAGMASALLLALLAAQLLGCQAAELVSLTVDVSNVTHEVEPRTLGCHSDNGYVHNSRALYSEMLYGVCFDGGLSSWGTLTLPAAGTVSTDAATQLHNKTSLKLALADGSPRVAVANRGLGNAGLVFHAGQPYTASMWASSATGAAGHVLVAALVSRQTNTTLAKAVVPLSGIIGSQWQWLNFSLTPSASTSCVTIEPGSDPSIKCKVTSGQGKSWPGYEEGHSCLSCSGELVLSVEQSPAAAAAAAGNGAGASVNIGLPSLLPGTSSAWHSDATDASRYAGYAVQPRNVEFLKAMGTKLMRLGGSFSSSASWLWTNWAGPKHERPACACTGQSTDFAGWGPFEFIDFATAAGIQPVLTTFLGTPSQMGDLVEYLWGDAATTPMGRLRTANGHPALYNLTVIELGNEGSASQSSWLDAVEAMEERAKALKLPPISYIFSDQAGLTGGNATRAGRMGLGDRLLTDIHVYYEWNGPKIAADLFEKQASVLPEQGAIVMETNDEGMPKDPCPHDMDRALIEASQLHQHLRTDLPRLKGRAASFCFESASGFYDAFDQGMVFFTQNDTFGQPPFHVHAMVAASMQPRNVAVAPPFDEMGADVRIDSTAGVSADGTHLTIRLLNRLNTSQTLTLSVVDGGDVDSTAHGGWVVEGVTLSAALNATNSLGTPDAVRPQPTTVSHWEGAGKPNSVDLPPFSYTIYQLNLTTASSKRVVADV